MDVIEFARDALDITTVIEPRFVSVVEPWGFRRAIVRRIAIAESVRHEEIDEVLWAESLGAMRRGFEDFPSQGCSLRVGRRCLLGRLGQFGQSGQFELDRTGFAIRGDMQIGKEVMPVLTGLEIRKLQSLAIGGQD